MFSEFKSYCHSPHLKAMLNNFTLHLMRDNFVNIKPYHILINLSFREAEPFFRCWQVVKWAGNSCHLYRQIIFYVFNDYLPLDPILTLESSPHTNIHVCRTYFNIILSLTLGLTCILLLSNFPTKIVY